MGGGQPVHFPGLRAHAGLGLEAGALHPAGDRPHAGIPACQPVGTGGAGMKPLKTEVAFATPWFQILGKTMRQGEEPYYSLKLPDYAAVVAITDDERVLIVRQYRPAVEHDTLELPSGLVDAGETPEEAARRELLEETGYQAGDVAVLGGMEPDTGRLGNRIWSFVAKGVRRVEGRAPEEGITVLTWVAGGAGAGHGGWPLRPRAACGGGDDGGLEGRREAASSHKVSAADLPPGLVPALPRGLLTRHATKLREKSGWSNGAVFRDNTFYVGGVARYGHALNQETQAVDDADVRTAVRQSSKTWPLRQQTVERPFRLPCPHSWGHSSSAPSRQYAAGVSIPPRSSSVPLDSEATGVCQGGYLLQAHGSPPLPKRSSPRRQLYRLSRHHRQPPSFIPPLGRARPLHALSAAYLNRRLGPSRAQIKAIPRQRMPCHRPRFRPAVHPHLATALPLHVLAVNVVPGKFHCIDPIQRQRLHCIVQQPVHADHVAIKRLRRHRRPAGQHLGRDVVVAIGPMLPLVQPTLIASFVTGAVKDELVVPRHVDPRNPLGIGAP